MAKIGKLFLNAYKLEIAHKLDHMHKSIFKELAKNKWGVKVGREV
jgi:hypothetical protein